MTTNDITVGEFFRNNDVVAGRIFKRSDTTYLQTEYVWVGTRRVKEVDGETKDFAIYNALDGFGGYDVDLSSENIFELVYELGNVKTIDVTLRSAISDINMYCLGYEEASSEANEFRSKFNDVRRDFATLNKHINDYAEEENFCSEYEARLEVWNNTFVSMKLEARPREYYVKVKMEGYLGWIKVKATSKDNAKTIVAELSPKQAFRQMIEQGDFYREDEENIKSPEIFEVSM